MLLLPCHHPAVLAKQLAAIDVLSRGPMSLLTISLGVLPGEAAAAGVDFTTRCQRADEAAVNLTGTPGTYAARTLARRPFADPEQRG